MDFGTLFAAADTLKTAAAALPKQTEQLKTLSGQLYQSWDKILVDMEVRGTGNARAYDQKIRTVSTTVADATGKAGASTSDEKWVDVSKAQYQAMEKNLGMAIEHKPAGKYDTESERVAQPAGFAYMAPPGQSNQYGHWETNNGTSFWVFYGQYALMRDLLFNRSYRPLDYREYHDYYTYRQRNETYYGRDTATQAPKYGTSGPPRRNATPAAPSPRAAASAIPSMPASRADIAIRSTPRRWPATPTPITARANSAPGPAVRRNRVPHRLLHARTGPRRRPIGPRCRAAVRDAVSGGEGSIVDDHARQNQRALYLGALLGVGFLHAEATPAKSLLVLAKTDNTLAIVDPKTRHVVARMPSGPDPHEVIASSDGSSPTSPTTAAGPTTP